MTTFSVTDAAFAGFRLMQDRPKTILVWAVVILLGVVLSAVLMIATGAGPAMDALRMLEESGNTDPSPVIKVLLGLRGAFVILLSVSVSYYSIIMAAAYRAYLRPDDRSMGAFHLGMDEVRMAAVLVLKFLQLPVFIFVFSLGLALVTTIAAPLPLPLKALVQLAAAVAVLAAWAYLWVGLSLAGPMTVDRGSVMFFRSWALTRGQFWRLAITYLLTFAVMGLVFVLAQIIIVALLAVVAALNGQGLTALGEMTAPDMTSFSSYFAPGAIIYQVLSSLLYAVLLAILTGPGAEAYRALAGVGARRVFD